MPIAGASLRDRTGPPKPVSSPHVTTTHVFDSLSSQGGTRRLREAPGSLGKFQFDKFWDTFWPVCRGLRDRRGPQKPASPPELPPPTWLPPSEATYHRDGRRASRQRIADSRVGGVTEHKPKVSDLILVSGRPLGPRGRSPIWGPESSLAGNLWPTFGQTCPPPGPL